MEEKRREAMVLIVLKNQCYMKSFTSYGSLELKSLERMRLSIDYSQKGPQIPRSVVFYTHLSLYTFGHPLLGSSLKLASLERIFMYSLELILSSAYTKNYTLNLGLK